MMSRLATVTTIAIALCLGVAQWAQAAGKTHDGKVVSTTAGTAAEDGKLVMTDNDGKNQHTHAIPASAKIMLNDKTAKLSDLKSGDKVKVTTDSNGKVTEVAATR